MRQHTSHCIAAFHAPQSLPSFSQLPCTEALLLQAPGQDVLGGILAHIQAILGRSVGPQEPLMEAGLDSLAAVELRNALSTHWAVSLPATFIFDYPTAAAMTQYRQEQLGMPGTQAVKAALALLPAVQQTAARSGSAIVGVACRYPGAAAGGIC